MDDDLTQVKRSLAMVAASLQVIGTQAEMTARSAQTTADEVQRLERTFASLDLHLTRVFGEQAEMRAWRESTDARLDALEKRQPPAA